MNQRNHALSTLRIETRYNGPPGIGNGGIVCAALAGACGDAFEVELRRPAPLEHDLDVVATDRGDFDLMDGDHVIARGRPAEVLIDVPLPPSQAAAERAHAAALRNSHPFPHCFVCGPARADGDGLRIVPGPVEGRPGLVASPWRPHAIFEAEGSGLVDGRFVFAALDCPSGIAALEGRPRPILLARFRATLHRHPAIGEACLCIGWPISHEGRKHLAGSALIGADGGMLGRSESLWIEPRPEVGAPT